MTTDSMIQDDITAPSPASDSTALAPNPKEQPWSNHDNQEFYELITPEGLQKFAVKGGLASGCDMKLLTPYWSKAQSILEVGAGYGRVIDYLLKHQFQGTITAIERCNVLFDYLQTTFSQYENVSLLHDDIRFLGDTNDRFDLILFLWSGLADFSAQEQPVVIKKLAKLSNKNGHLIVDSMPPNVVPLQAYQVEKQSFLIEIKDFVVHMYIPTNDEIKRYANEAGLHNVNAVCYRTDANREKWLYILS